MAAMFCCMSLTRPATTPTVSSKVRLSRVWSCSSLGIDAFTRRLLLLLVTEALGSGMDNGLGAEIGVAALGATNGGVAGLGVWSLAAAGARFASLGTSPAQRQRSSTKRYVNVDL